MISKRISICLLTMLAVMMLIIPSYAGAYIQDVDGSWFWCEDFDDDTGEIDSSFYRFTGTYYPKTDQYPYIEYMKNRLDIVIDANHAEVLYVDHTIEDKEWLHTSIDISSVISDNELDFMIYGYGQDDYYNGKSTRGRYQMHLWLYDDYVDYTLTLINKGYISPDSCLSDSQGRLYKNPDGLFSYYTTWNPY